MINPCVVFIMIICLIVTLFIFYFLAKIVCELPSGTNWNFDVHWYNKIPGVISASSFDGKIGIYNVEVHTCVSVFCLYF